MGSQNCENVGICNSFEKLPVSKAMVFPESYGRMWQWAESENLKELLLFAYWEKVHHMLPIPFLMLEAMILLYYDNVVNWLIFIQSNGLCFPPFFSKSCDKVGWFLICICKYARMCIELTVLKS